MTKTRTLKEERETAQPHRDYGTEAIPPQRDSTHELQKHAYTRGYKSPTYYALTRVGKYWH
jgi:hypothetical protein